MREAVQKDEPGICGGLCGQLSSSHSLKVPCRDLASGLSGQSFYIKISNFKMLSGSNKLLLSAYAYHFVTVALHLYINFQ